MRFRALLASLFLCALLPAQEIAAPGDTRYVVEDEVFEKASGDRTEQLAKEGRLVPYTVLAKQTPARRGSLTLAPASAGSLTPPEIADKLRH